MYVIYLLLHLTSKSNHLNITVSCSANVQLVFSENAKAVFRYSSITLIALT